MSSPRKPIEWHKLAGSERDAMRDRSKAGAGESSTVGGRPRMPKSVKADDVARAKWRDTVRILRGRGTLSTGDAQVIELLAVNYSQWLAALEHVRAHGNPMTITVPVRGGTAEVEKENPNVRTASDCAKQIHALSKSLGLTGIDRDKVKRVKPTEAEQIAKPGSALDQFPELFGRKSKREEAINEPDEDESESSTDESTPN
jgi:P27 family predicted phage terminase small subunit